MFRLSWSSWMDGMKRHHFCCIVSPASADRWPRRLSLSADPRRVENTRPRGACGLRRRTPNQTGGLWPWRTGSCVAVADFLPRSR